MLVFHAVDGEDLDHGVVGGVVAVDVGIVAQFGVALGDDDDGAVGQRHMKVFRVHAQGQGVDVDRGAHAQSQRRGELVLLAGFGEFFLQFLGSAFEERFHRVADHVASILSNFDQSISAASMRRAAMK